MDNEKDMFDKLLNDLNPNKQNDLGTNRIIWLLDGVVELVEVFFATQFKHLMDLIREEQKTTLEEVRHMIAVAKAAIKK